MGYYVRVFKPKSKPVHWKLQFVSHKKKHTIESKAKKPKKEWDVPKARWYSLGFQVSMTVEQAKARAKQLNAKLHLKRREELHLAFDREAQMLQTKFNAAIPELFKNEFEQKYVHGRMNGPEWRKRFLRTWRAAQKLLLEVQTDPDDWYDEMFKFYDYFHERQYSFSYIRRILQLTNLWGYFLSRKMGHPFARVPMPRGKERERN